VSDVPEEDVPEEKAARFAAIVLAGQRAEGDPLAESQGQTWKALVPVGGRPMVERVLEALLASPSIGQIALAAPTPDLLDGMTSLEEAVRRGRLLILPTQAGPAASTAAAWDRLGQLCPTLVTTADHALLTPDLVASFCSRACASNAAIQAALVPATAIRTAFPEAKRTFLRFSDGAYSGANLFVLAAPEALRAVRFWQQVEQDRKHPWRIARRIGLDALLLYLLRRLSLEGALQRLTKVTGASARAVILPDAWASVDVDKLEDLVLAERILAERAEDTR